MIGIMSDSHDNVYAVRKAVRFFRNTECKLVIHAGDFVAPFAARELEKLDCPVKAVFGNCDGEKEGLGKVVSAFGEIRKAPFVFSYADKNFLITHIHLPVDRYTASGKYEVIIFGHTHEAEVKRKKGVLLINPGETGGWISGKSTVVLVDPSTWETEIVIL